MADGDFKFERCLLKHFVRQQGWLPVCRRRAAAVAASRAKGDRPRLKYFTFCAASALDVIMLDLEKVIHRSPKDLFDNVVFFDINDTFVAQTRQRIRGAIGFPTDFVECVLSDNAVEKASSDALTPLEAPEEGDFTAETIKKQRLASVRASFVQEFPFDIINLDLERYLFRPKEEIPGKLVNALRNVFTWQRSPATSKDGTRYSVDGFSLMFTLRIGPKDIGEDYQELMRECMADNIDQFPVLKPHFEKLSDGKNIVDFLKHDFEGFFKLAAPKTIVSLLRECDWQVDPETGISVFEFERETKKDPYRMLHMVMDVKRNDPPLERRRPGKEPAAARTAYETAVSRLFENRPVSVNTSLKEIGADKVEAHLNRVFAHRKKISGA